MEMPSELDLISLFECEPILLDIDTPGLPFFYNQATYQFSNNNEMFMFTICPSYNEIKIQVYDLPSNILISHLHLRRVTKFEIISDKLDSSEILLTLDHDETIQTLEISFKPKFKLILKDHHSRINL